MIPRKPVRSSTISDDPVSAVSPTTGTYSSTNSNPHSPEDIRAVPSPIQSSPISPRAETASFSDQFYDAPEVVPGSGGPVIMNASPDFGGEKLTLGVNNDPAAAPQTMYNMDPASGLQAGVPGSPSPPYSSIDSDPKSGPQAVNPTVFAGGAAAGAGAGAVGMDRAVTAGGSGPRKPWYKEKRFLILAAVAIFIIIGLAVGLGVGLTVGRDKNSNNNGGGDTGSGDDTGSGGGGSGSGDDNQGSPGTGEGHNGDGDENHVISCDGGLCPSILTAAVTDGQLNVFARTASNRLAVRTHDGDRWSNTWTDLGVVPGDGSSIISQPVAVAWEADDSPRLDVFVVSSQDNRIFGKHKIDDDGDWTNWVDLGPGAGSAIQACQGAEDRLYLWTIDDGSHNITRNQWIPDPEARRLKLRQNDDDDDDDDDDDEEEEGGRWDTTGERWSTASNPAQGPAASAPGVACRSSGILHDLVWYDRNADRVWHQSYNDSSSSWGSRRSFDGEWVGSPSIFSYPSSSTQRLDFFGIQEDNEVYHFSWATADGYSDVRSLGGSIASAPVSIIYPDSGSSTRDVFALGTDGKLAHQHYDGTAWANEWEDLNITARSAPSAMVFDDAAWLFWLSEDGSLMTGRMGASENPGREWADDIRVEDLGGDLTLEYFIDES